MKFMYDFTCNPDSIQNLYHKHPQTIYIYTRTFNLPSLSESVAIPILDFFFVIVYRPPPPYTATPLRTEFPRSLSADTGSSDHENGHIQGC